MLESSIFTIIIVLMSILDSFKCQACRVELSTGTIEGEIRITSYSPFGSQTAIQFLGIPFAAPPIGDLRFRKPERVSNWTGILETKKYQAACMSDPSATYKSANGPGQISEDCLYLNVFTNEYCLQNRNCSAMLVIHGGKYDHESASAFHPDIIINNFVGQDRNIVVVTTNYRLGIFGFANYPGIEGNVALYDLLEAVKWTHREIQAFGADPKNLTLMGHSAGATLINALTLSPLSAGLITRQIMMSPVMPTKTKSANSKIMKRVGELVNCSDVECLRKLSAQQLLDIQLEILANSTESIVEPHVDGEFIREYDEEILGNPQENLHRVTTMIGTVTGEMSGSIYCQDADGNVNVSRLSQLCEHISWRYSYTSPDELTQKCVAKYNEKSHAQKLSDDLDFFAPVRRIAAAHTSPNTNVYVYSFSYDGAGEAFAKYFSTSPSPSHSEDLIYIFGTHRVVEKMTLKDYEIERIYSQIFADFVNFGEPNKNLNWEPFNEPEGRYFEINFHDGKLKTPGAKLDYYTDAHQFWNIEVNRDFQRIHLETFPKSVDSLSTSVFIEPLQSHHQQKSANMVKNLKIMEQSYNEAEEFLEDLKKEVVTPILKNGTEIQIEHSHTSTHLFLLTVGCVLLIVMLYLAFSHWLMHRKREGYTLLK